MGREGPSLGKLEVENGNIQLALRRDPRVKLAQRAGGGVAGIGKGLLPVLLALGIERGKDLFRHVDLAAHDEARQLLRQHHGNGLDRAQILRHVLAHAPIAARGAADEHAVAVLERDGQTVHLRLHAVFDVLELLAHLLIEVHDLGVGEGVLQALERDGVRHRLELRQRHAAHALRGRVWRDLLGVLLLQICQLALEHIVFIVADARLVEHIVAVRVCVERVAQLLYAFLVVHGVLPFYPALFIMKSSAVEDISSRVSK